MNVAKGLILAIQLGNVLIPKVVITAIVHQMTQAVLLIVFTVTLNTMMEKYGTQTLINALNVLVTKG